MGALVVRLPASVLPPRTGSHARKARCGSSGSIAAPARGEGQTRTGLVHADIEIGLSLTGENNLAEGLLRQHPGDLRWAHMSQLSGRSSFRIGDGETRRLYAAFSGSEVASPVDGGDPAPIGVPVHLRLNVRMHVRSDERLTIVSTREEVMCGHAVDEFPCFSGLKAATTRP